MSIQHGMKTLIMDIDVKYQENAEEEMISFDSGHQEGFNDVIFGLGIEG